MEKQQDYFTAQDEFCTVRVGETEKKYRRGTRLGEAARDFQSAYEYPIVIAMADGKLTELYKKIKKDMTVEWITVADEIGYSVYCRSIHLLFYKAVYEVAGRNKLKKVMLHFTVSNGYYYTVDGDITLDQTFTQRVFERMRELVAAGLPIWKKRVSTDKARKLFRQYGMLDKDLLFKYRRVSNVNIYNLDGYEDYFYGFMVWNTGVLKTFRLMLYRDGILLQMPSRHDPFRIEPFSPSEKVFEVQRASERWGEKMGVDTVGRLNQAISEGKLEHLMLVQEAMQEGRIAQIARNIAQQKHLKFILIAGPSSSGKTSFSRRLAIQLTANGMTPHPISLDNYYRERESIPKDAEGAYDFESLEALDLELFRTQMRALLSGEEVSLPRYNFTTGQKEYKGEYLRLGENDILVLEGIHGLNPKMTEGLPDESKYKIYISALTQLNIDEHNRVSSTDGRLIRRIVRDYRTRATSAKETIAMWQSVRRGEETYIFPNQDRADEVVNSALIYEMAILKVYAEPLLFQIPEDAPEFPEAKRLLKFLDYFIGLPSDSVPNNSILREFIGGSCLDVG